MNTRERVKEIGAAPGRDGRPVLWAGIIAASAGVGLFLGLLASVFVVFADWLSPRHLLFFEQPFVVAADGQTASAHARVLLREGRMYECAVVMEVEEGFDRTGMLSLNLACTVEGKGVTIYPRQRESGFSHQISIDLEALSGDIYAHADENRWLTMEYATPWEEGAINMAPGPFTYLPFEYERRINFSGELIWLWRQSEHPAPVTIEAHIKAEDGTIPDGLRFYLRTERSLRP